MVGDRAGKPSGAVGFLRVAQNGNNNARTPKPIKPRFTKKLRFCYVAVTFRLRLGAAESALVFVVRYEPLYTLSLSP